ncbi:MAG: phosphotransferase [Candidatus Moraniibacteriota bacterium]
MVSSEDREIIFGICHKLKKEAGLDINESTVDKLSMQGFNSEVYMARADKGIIIHILKPAEEQIRQNINRKLMGVSKLIKSFIEIPSAEFFYEETLEDGRFIFVQEMLPGKNWGRRKLEDDKIVDEFYPPENKRYFEQLNTILVNLHKIKFTKYGWLKSEKKDVNGTYESWRDFLLIESELWLKNIWENSEKGYGISREVLSNVKNKLADLYNKNDHLFESGLASLVHGDMINPGNVLIEDARISGIIDFEWSLAGDAAWEFAYTGNPMIQHYFDFCDEVGVNCDRNLFLKKMKFYKILWLLWAVNVHAQGKELKKALFKEFIESLNA